MDSRAVLKNVSEMKMHLICCILMGISCQHVQGIYKAFMKCVGKLVNDIHNHKDKHCHYTRSLCEHTEHKHDIPWDKVVLGSTPIKG